MGINLRKSYFELDIAQLWGDMAGVDCFDTEVIAPQLGLSNSSASDAGIMPFL